MSDTGGDGWQGSTYEVLSSTSVGSQGEGSVLASGTLDSGSYGDAWICLANGCYELRVSANGANPSEIGFEFEDEHGGHFQDLQAPYHVRWIARDCARAMMIAD